MQVLEQLRLAAGILALRMDSWQTVVTDLVQSLTTMHDQSMHHLSCLLGLLTILPEVSTNKKLVVNHDRREIYRRMLCEAAPQVVQVMLAVQTQCRAREDIMERMLTCATSWTRHIELPADELVHLMPMACNSFAMGSMKLLDVAAEF